MDDFAVPLASGDRLALSAAMPGVAGAALRRGGRYAAMRAAITQRREDAPPAPIAQLEEPVWIELRCFNSIAEELAGHLLCRGLAARPADAGQVLLPLAATPPAGLALPGPDLLWLAAWQTRPCFAFFRLSLARNLALDNFSCAFPLPLIIFPTLSARGNYLEAWQMADKETGHDEINFESALENYLNPDFGDLEEGSITKGEIVRVDDDNVLVDVNFKSEGQIPAAELRDAAGNMAVSVGDRVDVYVVRKNEMDGTITLSFEKAKRMQVFDQLEDVQENNRVIKGHIVRRIKGGYTVDIGGVEAFLPGSHVDLRPVPDMDALVNQEFEFRVLKINRRRSNVIVSRRVLLEEERDSKRQDLLRTLEEGQIVQGKAKNITEYGVFVDLGGLDGLLHITDMSWKRIRHPKEMITMGQELTLKVLSFDRENNKVSLGLKQLVPDPWQDISARFPEGAKCTGKVTNLVDYGAFVELEPGVEGLVHISEMSWTRKLRHPSQMVTPATKWKWSSWAWTTGEASAWV